MLTTVAKFPLPKAVRKYFTPKQQEQKYTREEIDQIMSSLQKVNRKEEFGDINDY